MARIVRICVLATVLMGADVKRISGTSKLNPVTFRQRNPFFLSSEDSHRIHRYENHKRYEVKLGEAFRTGNHLKWGRELLSFSIRSNHAAKAGKLHLGSAPDLLKKLNRAKRLASDSTGGNYTCNLFLRSGPLLWKYIKNEKYPGTTLSDESTEREIMVLFGSHVDALNDIFSKTTFSSYDNSLSYSGIRFRIAKTKIMTDKCGQNNSTEWCDSSMEKLLLLSNKGNHEEFCLVYGFTYKVYDSQGGLSYTAGKNGQRGGICDRYDPAKDQTYNTGIINLYKYSSNTISHLAFAHEVGHNFGSLHYSGPACVPDIMGSDSSKGNYLMYKFTVSGTKEHNFQFSPCSRDNISRVLDSVINNKHNKVNCLYHNATSQTTALPLATSTAETVIGVKTNGVNDNHKAVGPEVWTTASACTALVICLCLAVSFPYVLWKRRVRFLMKLLYRFQTYEDNDEKEFDAFISYRSTEEDEYFVVHTLFPKLEKELKFKICVHFRDFMPGETIANNIIWGVENSRRTILVLTPSYINSEFCRFEYQRAQHEMLKQKHRIIPIILKDISSARKDMDETLRIILNSITYIEWPETSDPRKVDIFWEKLSLSMPKLRRNTLNLHSSEAHLVSAL